MYRSEIKNRRSSFWAAILISMTAFTLSGCGSKELDGYFTLDSVNEDGDVVKGDDLSDYGLDDCYVVFDDDEGYLVVMGSPEDFTYDSDDGIISTSHGDVSVRVSGSKVILEDSKVSMTFKKSKDKKPKKPEAVKVERPADAGSPNAAASSGSSASDIVSFWSGGWYGWWEIHAWSDKYDAYEDAKYPILASTWLTDNGEGGIFLWDSDGALGNVTCSNNGSGLTEYGTMVSESGTFFDGPIEHADWLIDPGLYDHSNYIQIEGHHYEDDDLQFDYTIHLVKWGEKWDDFNEDELPVDYDWYLDAINNGMSMPEP